MCLIFNFNADSDWEFDSDNDTDISYAQWVVIIIKNVGHTSCRIKNLHVSLGKLHADDDKNTEVRHSVYEGKLIGPGESMRINACGQNHVSEKGGGTWGDFDLLDSGNNHVIRHFHWRCPWESWIYPNEWDVTGSHEEWRVKHWGAHLEQGEPLGTITVEVSKKGKW